MCSAVLSQWPACADPLQPPQLIFAGGTLGHDKKSSVCTQRSRGSVRRQVQALSHLIAADRAVSEGAIISTPYGVEVQPPSLPPPPRLHQNPQAWRRLALCNELQRITRIRLKNSAAALKSVWSPERA